MKQAATILMVQTTGRGFTELTTDVAAWLDSTAIAQGVVSILCRHTSASLLIQENAAPAVRTDLAEWMDRLAPEDARYHHDDEGPDDMPAHLRATLTGVNLSIPVIGGRMALGTWQGIFLVEHRRRPHSREVAVHVIGE